MEEIKPETIKKGTKFEHAIPEGVSVEVSGSTITAKGKTGTLTRTFKTSGILIEARDKKLTASSKSNRREIRAMCGTIVAHARNMFKSLQNENVYKLKAFHAHFPMLIKTAGATVIVENFLGSKGTRKVEIPAGVKVEAKGADITVKGIDLEKVSQTAARLTEATRLAKKDRRVFQDGIYVVEKNGVPV